MRLKSEIWIKAYLRKCSAAGAPAVIVRHGDDDAGAIFIKISMLDGTAILYGPAPAGFEAGDAERSWVPHLGRPGTADAEVETYLEQQFDYDPDVWVVEVEDRQGRHFLGDWLSPKDAR